jgi:hypothetical protein
LNIFFKKFVESLKNSKDPDAESELDPGGKLNTVPPDPEHLQVTFGIESGGVR